ncbi:MAG: trigger factor [Chloroflexota bacterium]|nr:trigger factor [Chloroflexota bacterium]
MKVSAEKLPDSQVVLNVEAEPPEMEKFLDRAYRRLVQRVAVPGFRKGKTPRPMLERHVGKGAFLEQALEELLPELYRQAIHENGVDAIDEPRIELLQTEPVVFKATVAVRPAVDLGDYRQFRTAPETVEVPDSDVERSLEEVRSFHAPWEPVERAVAFGDLVTIDAVGTQDGKTFLDNKGAQYLVIKGSPSPVPGFAEQLEGVNKGQEMEFTLSFPQDYSEPQLTGKEGLFKVKVLEVKEKRLPSLDDEFAKGEGFASLEEMRNRAKESLLARAQAEARSRLEERVVEAVVEGAKVEPPPTVVEHEAEHLFEEQGRILQSSRLTMEEYLKHINKSEEELRKELQPLARKRVLRSFVLAKAAEEEKVDVSPEEIDAEVQRLVSEAGEEGKRVREALTSQSGRFSLRQVMMTRKTVERLVALATAPEAQAPAGEGKEEEGHGN